MHINFNKYNHVTQSYACDHVLCDCVSYNYNVSVRKLSQFQSCPYSEMEENIIKVKISRISIILHA